MPRRPAPAPTTGGVNRPGISPFLPSIGSRQGVSLTDRRPCGRRPFGGMWTSKDGSPTYAAAAPKQFAPANLRSSGWRGSRLEISHESGVHMSRDSAPGNAGVVAARRGNVVVVGHDASEGADLALTNLRWSLPLDCGRRS